MRFKIFCKAVLAAIGFYLFIGLTISFVTWEMVPFGPGAWPEPARLFFIFGLVVLIWMVAIADDEG